MNKETIIKLLSEIKYPGFSRDIISFGILKNIYIAEDEVVLELSMNTENNQIIKSVIENINNKFNNLNSSFNLKIDLQTNKEAKPSSDIDRPIRVYDHCRSFFVGSSAKCFGPYYLFI
mgnify:CR=1 FL=1